MANKHNGRTGNGLDLRSDSDLRETLNQLDYELKILEPDDYDQAILGVAELRWDGGDYGDAVLVYDYDKVVRVARRLIEGTREEAEEHVEYNVVGAYVGPGTPLFLRSIRSLREATS